jgi:hypothetical protein
VIESGAGQLEGLRQAFEGFQSRINNHQSTTNQQSKIGQSTML